jgi:hypothetical protein
MPDLEGLDEFEPWWDSVTGKMWSQFYYMSNFEKYGPSSKPTGWSQSPGYNLIHMTKPVWSTLSFDRLDSLARSAELVHFPILVEDRVSEAVFYEDVSWVPPFPGYFPDEVEDWMGFDEIHRTTTYKIDSYVNSMFMLTSQQLDDIMTTSNSDVALASFVERGRKTVHNLNTAGWSARFDGDAQDVLRSITGVMLEGIEPPIAGRELYSKITEKQLNLNNFISTNLNDTYIGAIPKYDQTPLGPGQFNSAKPSDDDWFSPPEVIKVLPLSGDAPVDTYGTTMADAPTGGSPEGSPGSSAPMGAPGY